MVMIDVAHVSKSIKHHEILKDISFQINAGECVALIGPNGSGKTTLLNLLLHNMVPTAGQITLNELDVANHQLKSEVGVLAQENVLPEHLRVKELVHFFQSIYDNSLSTDEIHELLDFTPAQYRQFTEQLSGGQKRLLAFVIALIGQPNILLLDEPTAAMDTSTRQRFWEIVEEQKAKGTTILYSSHYIEEVAHTANRILVLHKGKLIRDTTPHAMRAEDREQFFTIPLKYKAVVETLPMVHGIEVSSDSITFATREGAAVWAQLQQNGCLFDELEVTHRTLLDSIFETTKEGE